MLQQLSLYYHKDFIHDFQLDTFIEFHDALNCVSQRLELI